MKIKEYEIDILIILLASIATILALIFSKLFPQIQVLLLTILTITLPVIYQIGHLYSKEKIRNEGDRNYAEVEERIVDLSNQIGELEEENSTLIEYIDELDKNSIE